MTEDFSINPTNRIVLPNDRELRFKKLSFFIYYELIIFALS